MTEYERIVRVPLPVDLIRQMDRLVLQQSTGFSTRAEFIREAIEAMVLETTYGLAPVELGALDAVPVGVSAAGPVAARAVEAVTADALQDSASPYNLAETALPAGTATTVLADGIAVVADELMFGLHNRDFPSLWAASAIRTLTDHQGAVIAVEACLASVVSSAWTLAERVSVLTSPAGMKLTAMLPSNREKPQSAEAGFRSFAIGNYSDRNGTVTAEGPLFVWNVCQLGYDNSGKLSIGLTEPGALLLSDMAGLSLILPHEERYARRFLEHLRRWAPTDWLGFSTTISAVAGEVDRAALVASFVNAWPALRQDVAATNAAGYLARSREWGLVEPKQQDGRYLLTAFGKSMAANELARGEK